MNRSPEYEAGAWDQQIAEYYHDVATLEEQAYYKILLEQESQISEQRATWEKLTPEQKEALAQQAIEHLTNTINFDDEETLHALATITDEIILGDPTKLPKLYHAIPLVIDKINQAEKTAKRGIGAIKLLRIVLTSIFDPEAAIEASIEVISQSLNKLPAPAMRHFDPFHELNEADTTEIQLQAAIKVIDENLENPNISPVLRKLLQSRRAHHYAKTKAGIHEKQVVIDNQSNATKQSKWSLREQQEVEQDKVAHGNRSDPLLEKMDKKHAKAKAKKEVEKRETDRVLGIPEHATPEQRNIIIKEHLDRLDAETKAIESRRVIYQQLRKDVASHVPNTPQVPSEDALKTTKSQGSEIEIDMPKAPPMTRTWEEVRRAAKTKEELEYTKKLKKSEQARSKKGSTDKATAEKTVEKPETKSESPLQQALLKQKPPGGKT